MTDIQVDRRISLDDLNRLQKFLPRELQPRNVSEAVRQRRHENNQDFLLFSASAELSEESHHHLIAGGWCAASNPSSIELSPLRPVTYDRPCFHATRCDRIESILSNGLMPGHLSGIAPNLGFTNARYLVHVSTTVSDAIKWATFPHLLQLANPTYLRVDIGQLNERIFADPHSSSGLVTNIDRISKDALRVLSATDIENALWHEVEEMLSHHQDRSDDTPLETLNRIFRNLVPGAPTVSKSAFSVALRGFYWRQLEGMRRKDYSTTSPRRTDCPIVLVQHRGYFCVIDGSKRANKRIEAGRVLENDLDMIEKPLSAIVIEQNASAIHAVTT